MGFVSLVASAAEIIWECQVIFQSLIKICCCRYLQFLMRIRKKSVHTREITLSSEYAAGVKSHLKWIDLLMNECLEII